MTDASYTHITVLADRTGSMGGIADPGSGVTKAQLTTEGIHRLIAEQAAQPGKTTFSLVQFDTMGTDPIAWFARADDPGITSWRIMPRSGTNLLDATGTLIVQTGESLATFPENERPGRVYFVIGTDGEENSSHEYSKAQVADMIAMQRTAYGWEFIFIGADIDAFAEAGGMGVTRGSTMTTNSANIGVAYAATSDAITRSRAGGQSVSYTDEERKQAGS
jgi:hypothetical protein